MKNVEKTTKQRPKSGQEAPRLAKKLQESPQDAPREPRASKKLPHEAPNPPKRVPKSRPKSIKIVKKSILEPPKAPKSSQGRSKTDFVPIFSQFSSDLGTIFES